jgi:K+-sensing histidine kinase KdpD
MITIRQFENKVLCEFIDSGSGFKKEVLENPFRLFSNTSEHVDENTGLNLLLIKYIMDAHNGQIEIYNNESKGATVRLTFVDQNQAI